MVFLYSMNTATATERMPDIQTQPRAIIRRQVQEWFEWMDHILDVHRSHFVFVNPHRHNFKNITVFDGRHPNLSCL